MKSTFLITISVILFSCSNSSVTNLDSLSEADSTKASVLIPNEMEVIDTILGIDVSHFQGNVDWKEVNSMGYSFAYAKASQGIGFHDPKFKENWENVRSAGMKRGAYHFFVAGEDASKQAELFISVLGDLESGDMYPMLDLESGGVKEEISVDDYVKSVKVFLDAVEEKYGLKPIIYTSNNFGDKYLKDLSFSAYPLWIAEYSEHAPFIPGAWKNKGKFTLWQFTEKDSIQTEGELFDEDKFIGTKSEFNQICY
jgi:lysozyme